MAPWSTWSAVINLTPSTGREALFCKTLGKKCFAPPRSSLARWPLRAPLSCALSAPARRATSSSSRGWTRRSSSCQRRAAPPPRRARLPAPALTALEPSQTPNEYSNVSLAGITTALFPHSGLILSNLVGTRIELSLSHGRASAEALVDDLLSSAAEVYSAASALLISPRVGCTHVLPLSDEFEGGPSVSRFDLPISLDASFAEVSPAGAVCQLRRRGVDIYDVAPRCADALALIPKGGRRAVPLPAFAWAELRLGDTLVSSEAQAELVQEFALVEPPQPVEAPPLLERARKRRGQTGAGGPLALNSTQVDTCSVVVAGRSGAVL